MLVRVNAGKKIQPANKDTFFKSKKGAKNLVILQGKIPYLFASASSAEHKTGSESSKIF